MAYSVTASTGEHGFSIHRISSKRRAIVCAHMMAGDWWLVTVTGPKGIAVAQFRDGKRVEG